MTLRIIGPGTGGDLIDRTWTTTRGGEVELTVNGTKVLVMVVDVK